MPVKRHQCSLLLDRPFKNLRIVSPRLANLRRLNNVMPRIAQQRGQFDPKHLIEVKACHTSCRVERGYFRVQNGMPGVFQSSLYVRSCQFRITSQQ